MRWSPGQSVGAVASQSPSTPTQLSFTLANNLPSLEPEKKLFGLKSKWECLSKSKAGLRAVLLSRNWPHLAAVLSKRRKGMCLWIPLDLQTGYGIQVLSHRGMVAKSQRNIGMTSTSASAASVGCLSSKGRARGLLSCPQNS